MLELFLAAGVVMAAMGALGKIKIVMLMTLRAGFLGQRIVQYSVLFVHGDKQTYRKHDHTHNQTQTGKLHKRL